MFAVIIPITEYRDISAYHHGLLVFMAARVHVLVEPLKIWIAMRDHIGLESGLDRPGNLAYLE